MPSQSERQKVYLVLDHEDMVLAVYGTWQDADIYIRREWSDINGPILWRAEPYPVLAAGETPEETP